MIAYYFIAPGLYAATILHYDYLAIGIQLSVCLLVLYNSFRTSRKGALHSLIYTLPSCLSQGLYSIVTISIGALCSTSYNFVRLPIHYARRMYLRMYLILLVPAIAFNLFAFQLYFDDHILVNQYFIGNRLLGLNGSPSILGVVTGFIMLFCITSYSFKSLLKWSLLFVILLWTGSKTAIFSLMAAYVSIYLTPNRRLVFSIFIASLPFLASVFYASDATIGLRSIIESATTYRVLNWTNALDFYLRLNIVDQVLGIGHMTLVDEPLFYETTDGLSYGYGTALESSYLKLLVNYGIYGVVFVGILIKKYVSEGNRILSRAQFYLLFCSVMDDSVISIQFIPLILVFFFGFKYENK